MKHGDMRPGDLLLIDDRVCYMIISVVASSTRPDLVRVTKMCVWSRYGGTGWFSTLSWPKDVDSIGAIVARGG